MRQGERLLSSAGEAAALAFSPSRMAQAGLAG